MDLKELIHFGEDKTDCILFSITKSFSKLNITNANNNNDDDDDVVFVKRVPVHLRDW